MTHTEKSVLSKGEARRDEKCERETECDRRKREKDADMEQSGSKFWRNGRNQGEHLPGS